MLIFLCFGTSHAWLTMGPTQSAVCTETYDPAVTADTDRPFGITSAALDFYGMKYVPQQTENTCRIEVNIRATNGDTGIIDNYNYHLAVFELNGNDANSLEGTSGAVTITGTGQYYFDFASDITLTLTKSYGFGLFIDSDADTTDDPSAEGDDTNYPSFGDDNGQLGITPQAEHGGRYHWVWDAAIPYAGTVDDADDGVDFKVWTK